MLHNPSWERRGYGEEEQAGPRSGPRRAMRFPPGGQASEGMR